MLCRVYSMFGLLTECQNLSLTFVTFLHILRSIRQFSSRENVTVRYKPTCDNKKSKYVPVQCKCKLFNANKYKTIK